eukprot:1641825-Rhodomonas_salina.2
MSTGTRRRGPSTPRRHRSGAPPACTRRSRPRSRTGSRCTRPRSGHSTPQVPKRAVLEIAVEEPHRQRARVPRVAALHPVLDHRRRLSPRQPRHQLRPNHAPVGEVPPAARAQPHLLAPLLRLQPEQPHQHVARCPCVLVAVEVSGRPNLRGAVRHCPALRTVHRCDRHFHRPDTLEVPVPAVHLPVARVPALARARERPGRVAAVCERVAPVQPLRALVHVAARPRR